MSQTRSALFALALADPALAQRNDENAVSEAVDSFEKKPAIGSGGNFCERPVRPSGSNRDDRPFAQESTLLLPASFRDKAGSRQARR